MTRRTSIPAGLSTMLNEGAPVTRRHAPPTPAHRLAAPQGRGRRLDSSLAQALSVDTDQVEDSLGLPLTVLVRLRWPTIDNAVGRRIAAPTHQEPAPMAKGRGSIREEGFAAPRGRSAVEYSLGPSGLSRSCATAPRRPAGAGSHRGRRPFVGGRSAGQSACRDPSRGEGRRSHVPG